MIAPRHYTYEEFPAAPETCPGMKTIQTRRDEQKISYQANVEYDAYPGGSLCLQVLAPYYADGRKAAFPCVVFVQGSGWGVQNVYSNVASLSKLAEKGYVVAVVQYRHSAVAPFPAQVIDTRTAIKFLRKNAEKYWIDPDRFAVFGDSSGGHTSLMVNITEGLPEFSSSKYPEYSDHVSACVDFYGPTAIYEMNEAPSGMDHCGADSPEGMLIGGVDVLKNLELAKRTDPVEYLKKERPIAPILIFHGDKDPVVPFRQSVRLYEALRANEKKAFFYKMLGAEHGGPGFWTEEVLGLIDAFLQKCFNSVF